MKIKATYRAQEGRFDPDVNPGQTREVFTDRPTYSEVLGPDGWPLEYEYEPLGFDLTARSNA